MAVYTKINSKDILSLSKKFELGKIIKFQGIKQGIENTNYLLKTNQNPHQQSLGARRGFCPYALDSKAQGDHLSLNPLQIN